MERDTNGLLIHGLHLNNILLVQHCLYFLFTLKLRLFRKNTCKLGKFRRVNSSERQR
jgi:hypothetical protein